MAVSLGRSGARRNAGFGGRLARRERRGEPVAFARNGLDDRRLPRLGFDLFPEASDHHVNAAVEWNVTSPRPGVEQQVAAQHPAGLAHEFAQEGELAPRQCDLFAGFALKDAGVEVENEPREAKRSARFLLRALAGVPRHIRRSVHHWGPLAGPPQIVRRSTSDDYNDYSPETSWSNAVYEALQ
jgi:hypothetical protein